MSKPVSYPSLLPGIAVAGGNPQPPGTGNSDGNFVATDSNVLLLYTGL